MIKTASDNFCGLKENLSSYKKAKAVIIPVPYEMTTTYMKGTAKAPRAVIEASKYLELYDEEIDTTVCDIGIATLAPLKISARPEIMVEKVKQHCLSLFSTFPYR